MNNTSLETAVILANGMFRTPFAKTAHGLVRGPCPRTRCLDLDGSFDLARDPATGGFVVEEGRLRLLDRPGLGVDLLG
jgi:hypothetical protein